MYVRDLAIQMVQEGHDVCIAYISDASFLNRSSDFQSEFKEQIVKAGVRCVEIGHDCRRYLWRGGKRLRLISQDFQPDIIHSHLYYGIFFKAFARLSFPLVYTHHSSHLGKGRYLYPFLNKIVDRYIGISSDCAEVLRAVGATDVAVVYNCVNSDRLKVKETYCAKNDICLIAVGSLGVPKNFTNLIEATDILLNRRFELRARLLLKIAGEGPLKAVLQRQINLKGLERNISLLGNRRDIPELLHRADVFVLSSDYEGLPIALLEAMMTGLPVVVTDVGGCRDVVESCNAGLVVPPGSADALARALECMITDKQSREEYGRNALKGSSQYKISRSVEAHLLLYKNLCSSR